MLRASHRRRPLLPLTRWLPSLLAAGCGRIGFDAATPDAPSPARSILSLDRVVPDAPFTDVPVPITLDASRADLAKLTPETFHAFIGATELPVEIESAGPPFVAWVLVPSITDLTTSITIEYGGAPVTHLPVWDASYAGVWHMTGDGRDSSTFARSSIVTALTPGPGVIGPATTYAPPSMSCIVVPSFETFHYLQATMSGWMFLNTTTAGAYHTIITRQLDDQVTDDFILGTDSSHRTLSAVYTESTGSPSRLGSVVSLGVWHHFALTYDGAQSALYLDGVVDTGGPASGIPVTSARPGMIGCGRNMNIVPIEQSDGDWIDGALDEVRFETVARSAAWIAYQVAAERDQVITYGPVEE